GPGVYGAVSLKECHFKGRHWELRIGSGAGSAKYTGVTSNLVTRVSEHKQNINCAFTAKHNAKTHVYYAIFEQMEESIAEEKRIKGGSREKKLALIEGMNPQWKDMYGTLF